MKLKNLTVFLLIIVLCAASALTVNAETIYILDGYSYSIQDENSITLENWNTDISPTLTLPDTLLNRQFVSIANWAFENNTDLTGLDLSGAAHLQQIGYESFIGCSAIKTDLVLPESLTGLNQRAFCYCSSIPTVSIQGDVKVIPVECFYGCSSLLTVILPDDLKSIQSWAFGDCTKLAYVEIPRSVTNISDTAFANDTDLMLGVWYGSVGYTYAKAHSMPYILLDGLMLGDVNGDSCTSILDVTDIQRHLANIQPLDGVFLYAADVNKDGTVTINDAMTLQKYLAKYELEYPIGKDLE